MRETCGRCASAIIPLRDVATLWGVLVVLRPIAEAPFTTDDASQLQLVVDMASIAFKRAHLIEQLRVEHDRLRRSEQRARLIADIGRTLGSSLDYEQTLRDAARHVVPAFADWCTIDLLDSRGGGVRRTVLTNDGPSAVAAGTELEERYPPRMAQSTNVMDVIRSGEPKLWPELPADLVRQFAQDEHHAQLLFTLGMESAMLVPISAHQKTFGAITFVSSDTARRYDDADLQFAVDFGERAGIAIENSRLHREAVDSGDRLGDMLERIGDAFYALDSDWRLTYANPSADRLLKQLMSIATTALVGKNIWSVVPQIIGTPFERALREAMERRRNMHIEEFFEPANAWIEVSVYPMNEGVSVFARDVTERRRSQNATATLAEAGARVAAATDYSTTLNEVVQAVVPSFADYCIIELETNGLERSAFSHRDAAGRAIIEETKAFPIHLDHRLAEPLRTSRPLLIERLRDADLDTIAQTPEHRALMERLGPRSMLVAPLVSRAHTLGLMVFARTAASGQYYVPADIELAAELGRRAGSAVEKAKLQRDLDRAVHARDDMLAVVAHDLRNPIATIAMSASLMQEPFLDDDEKEKQIAIIRRGTERANRLIADLLDIAGIEAGKFALDRKAVDVGALLREVCELFGRLAADRELAFECRIDECLPLISADRDRIVQIISNLLENAIKFTPNGGRIRVSANPRPSEVEFVVSDNGRGIAPNELPHVFARFWQSKRGGGGAGLGLAIVKGLVEAHGGRVSVQSVATGGTTFTFTIPRE